MAKSPRQRAAAALLVGGVILPVAAVARLWGIWFCLPHPHCRPDEDAISAIAGGLRWGDLNPHVFNYPALFMVAVATVLVTLRGVERLLHKVMPFHFRSLLDDASGTTINYMVARLLSAAAGIASVWVIFRIALRLFDRTTALAAAALLALAYLHVRDSHYGVTDVPMTFMVLIAFLYVVRLSESGARRDLAIAGLTAGLATSTKYNAAMVALPGLFAIFGCLPGTKSMRARFSDAAIFVVLMVAAFVCTSPYSLLDFQNFMADVTADAQHLSEGHGVDLGRGWVFHATTTLRYGVGAPILGAGVTGMLLLILRSPRRGLLVALFPVSYYALLGSGYTVFTRHMVPVVPFLCLTAAYFIAESARLACSTAASATMEPDAGDSRTGRPPVAVGPFRRDVRRRSWREPTTDCSQGAGSSSVSRRERRSRRSDGMAGMSFIMISEVRYTTIEFSRRRSPARHRRRPILADAGCTRTRRHGARPEDRLHVGICQRRCGTRPTERLRSAGRVLPSVRRFPAHRSTRAKSQGLCSARKRARHPRGSGRQVGEAKAGVWDGSSPAGRWSKSGDHGLRPIAFGGESARHHAPLTSSTHGLPDFSIMISIAQRIADELNVRVPQVDAAIALLDDKATVPFIARYRKEATGGLDDTQLRTLEERLTYLRELEERRAAILKSIEEQGKLTPELARVDRRRRDQGAARRSLPAVQAEAPDEGADRARSRARAARPARCCRIPTLRARSTKRPRTSTPTRASPTPPRRSKARAGS